MKKISFVLSLFIVSQSFCIKSSTKEHSLVNIQKINSTIDIDLRYATKNNFTNQQIYSQAKCYVHRDVAHALDAVQKELKRAGLGLKVWDGYRPLSAQWKLWNIVPDERYVTDPRKGGRHTRGTAVDVTLISLSDGKEVEMPTEFDNFTQRAWSDYDDIPKVAKQNRKTLRDSMEKHGFVGIKCEWWHFDWKTWRDYPVLDIELGDLE